MLLIAAVVVPNSVAGNADVTVINVEALGVVADSTWSVVVVTVPSVVVILIVSGFILIVSGLLLTVADVVVPNTVAGNADVTGTKVETLSVVADSIRPVVVVTVSSVAFILIVSGLLLTVAAVVVPNSVAGNADVTRTKVEAVGVVADSTRPVVVVTVSSVAFILIVSGLLLTVADVVVPNTVAGNADVTRTKVEAVGVVADSTRPVVVVTVSSVVAFLIVSGSLLTVAAVVVPNAVAGNGDVIGTKGEVADVIVPNAVAGNADVTGTKVESLVADVVVPNTVAGNADVTVAGNADVTGTKVEALSVVADSTRPVVVVTVSSAVFILIVSGSLLTVADLVVPNAVSGNADVTGTKVEALGVVADSTRPVVVVTVSSAVFILIVSGSLLTVTDVVVPNTVAGNADVTGTKVEALGVVADSTRPVVVVTVSSAVFILIVSGSLLTVTDVVVPNTVAGNADVTGTKVEALGVVADSTRPVVVVTVSSAVFILIVSGSLLTVTDVVVPNTVAGNADVTGTKVEALGVVADSTRPVVVVTVSSAVFILIVSGSLLTVTDVVVPNTVAGNADVTGTKVEALGVVADSTRPVVVVVTVSSVVVILIVSGSLLTVADLVVPNAVAGNAEVTGTKVEALGVVADSTRPVVVVVTVSSVVVILIVSGSLLTVADLVVPNAVAGNAEVTGTKVEALGVVADSTRPVVVVVTVSSVVVILIVSGSLLTVADLVVPNAVAGNAEVTGTKVEALGVVADSTRPVVVVVTVSSVVVILIVSGSLLTVADLVVPNAVAGNAEVTGTKVEALGVVADSTRPVVVVVTVSSVVVILIVSGSLLTVADVVVPNTVAGNGDVTGTKVEALGVVADSARPVVVVTVSSVVVILIVSGSLLTVADVVVPNAVAGSADVTVKNVEALGVVADFTRPIVVVTVSSVVFILIVSGSLLTVADVVVRNAVAGKSDVTGTKVEALGVVTDSTRPVVVVTVSSVVVILIFSGSLLTVADVVVPNAVAGNADVTGTKGEGLGVVADSTRPVVVVTVSSVVVILIFSGSLLTVADVVVPNAVAGNADVTGTKGEGLGVVADSTRPVVVVTVSSVVVILIFSGSLLTVADVVVPNAVAGNADVTGTKGEGLGVVADSTRPVVVDSVYSVVFILIVSGLLLTVAAVVVPNSVADNADVTVTNVEALGVVADFTRPVVVVTVSSVVVILIVSGSLLTVADVVVPNTVAGKADVTGTKVEGLGVVADSTRPVLVVIVSSLVFILIVSGLLLTFAAVVVPNSVSGNADVTGTKLS
ncbi:uncharacterized protein [Sinocyclocheilus grahami]|uniref:uncharacterized protein n=1 Tax=Sinocyclocheilus grahami TaxID=75366 RepID=UPI0007ACA294|nr:PREDICTED: uncharacterized protein LOC107552420 [Sinocyclocheilus grahami]